MEPMQVQMQKRYRSVGVYDRLIALAKHFRDQGQADTVEQALEVVLPRENDLVTRLLEGPKDPTWHYWPVIKRLTGWVDPMDAVTAHKEAIRKAWPPYYEYERRGGLMRPIEAPQPRAVTTVQKQASAWDEISTLATSIVSKSAGMSFDTAVEQVMRERPDLYERHRRESVQR
jgi:hypothetical protein